jgi:hypothetical protein
MPKLSKSFHLEITVEQFLNACSASELKELDLLLSSPRYQYKMNGVIQNLDPLPFQTALVEAGKALHESKINKE